MRLLLTSVALAALGACASTTNFEASDQLAEDAQGILSRTEVPAIGLAVVSCEAGALHVQGKQRADAETLIDEMARFNIGSNSKSMLATIAARLEQRGRLNLDDPLSDLWPEAVAAHPDKADITLAQLLSHRSGLPTFDTGTALGSVPDFEGERASIRRQAALYFLDQPLIAEPGTTSAYSNAGYVVASAVLEEVTSTPLPALLEAELFAPLRIDGELGEPRNMGSLQPYGHYQSDGAVVAYTDEEGPIPAFLEGAGNVALTTADYAAYVQMHLCALQGESRFLTQASAERLHGEGGEDGLGWGRTELGGDPVSFHVGGTGDFTAYMVVSKGQDKAAVAVLNVGGEPANAGLAWIVGTMTPAEEELPEAP